MLSENHIKQLEKESGISPETLEDSGIETVEGNNPGISFTYLDVESKKTFGTRVKLDKPSENVKYLSKEGAEPGIYFHPKDLEDLHEPSIPLIIAEGEKKALKGHQELKGYVVTGIPGCWGFSHNKELSPQWQAVPLEGRDVILCPDTDFKTNSKVSAALVSMIIQLLAEGAKVSVMSLSIKGEESKVGLDDYLMKEGAGKFKNLNPLWSFGLPEPGDLPKKASLKKLKPILKKMILNPAVDVDPVITGISKMFSIGKRLLKNLISKYREEWENSVVKRDDNVVYWNKHSTSNTQVVKDVVRALEKDGDLFLYGAKKTLAMIRQGELKIFIDTSSLASEISTRIDLKISNSGGETIKQEYSMFPHSLVSAVALEAAKSKKLRHVMIVTKNPVYMEGKVYHKPGFYSDVKLQYIGPEIKPIEGLHYTRKALDYPYSSKKSAINALGCLIGATLLRASMPGKHPSYIVQGNQQNLGKTSIAHTMSMVAIGTRAGEASFKTNDEEMEKELGARAKVSDFIALDNIKNSSVSSPVIERLITGKDFETRQLGTSELISRLNDMQIFFTSNGGGFSKDIVVRSVPIFLSSENAKVRKSIIDYAEDNREKILGELLNLVFKWMEKGSPLHHVRFDKFQVWADTVNGILVTSGIKGFLSNFEENAGKLDPLTKAILDIAVDEILESEEKKTRSLSASGWRLRLESSGYTKFFKNIESIRGKDTSLGIALRKMQGKVYPVTEAEDTLLLRTSSNLCALKKYTLYSFGLQGDGPRDEVQTSKEPNLDLMSGKKIKENKELITNNKPSELIINEKENNVKKVVNNDIFIGNIIDGDRGSKSDKSPLWWAGEYIGEKLSFDTETP